jgi:hypothetical protein
MTRVPTSIDIPAPTQAVCAVATDLSQVRARETGDLLARLKALVEA